MSTRCQLGFYETDNQNISKPNAVIYRHSDGYPEGKHGVVEQILPMLGAFKKHRGADAEYCAAWTLFQLMHKTVGDYNPDKCKDWTQFYGYGICNPDDPLHGDIEYYYAVYPSRLEVRQDGFNGELLERHDF